MDDPSRLWHRIENHHIAVFLAVEMVLVIVVYGYSQRTIQQHTSRDVAAQVRQTQLQLAILSAIGKQFNTHAQASENRDCADATMQRYLMKLEERHLTTLQRQRLDGYVRVACSYTLPGGRSAICESPPKANAPQATATALVTNAVSTVLTAFTGDKPRMTDIVRAYVFHREGRRHFSRKIGYGALDDALDARLEQGEGPYRMGRLRADGTFVHKTITNWRTSNEAVRYFPPHLRDAAVGSTWRIASRSRPDWGLRIKVRQFTPGERVIMAAKTQLGVRYVWAAEKPNVAFDCSGLTSWAWGTVGVNLPHQSEAQRQLCTKIPADKAKPGDLVMWDFNGSGVSTHVGLYLKPGYVIDTRSPDGEPVGIRPIEGPPYLMGYYRPPGV